MTNPPARAAAAAGRRLLVVALACAIPFTLLAAWARLTPIGGWEVELLLAIALPVGLYGDAVRAFNTFGDLWVWVLLVAALAAALLAVRRRAAAALVALTLAGDLLGFGVKLLVERARPDGAIVEHLFGGDTFAFPSGHVLRATALGAALVWIAAPQALRLPAALAAGLVVGALMGYARVSLGVHWPSDAAGGLLLGLAWFALTAAVIEKPGQGERTKR